MNLGTVLVIIGVVLAFLDIFFAKRVHYLLHIALVLVGLGVLLGATPIAKV